MGDSLDSDVIKEKIRSEGLNAYSAQLMDDRRIYLGFHGSLKESRMAIQEDSSAFMSQLQAGLEGYVLILHEGEIYVSPQDEEGMRVKNMVSKMLETGKLNPEALKLKAENNGRKASMDITGNSGTG